MTIRSADCRNWLQAKIEKKFFRLKQLGRRIGMQKNALPSRKHSIMQNSVKTKN